MFCVPLNVNVCDKCKCKAVKAINIFKNFFFFSETYNLYNIRVYETDYQPHKHGDIYTLGLQIYGEFYYC